jgi:uncharacterized repeat protein (TIGR04052 family)
MKNSILLLIAFVAVTFSACGGGGGGGGDRADTPLQLRFNAVADGQEVNCGSDISGVGPDGGSRIGISDLRFYVSNVVAYDESGKEIDTEIDYNDFQYKDSGGSVALIDLTSNTTGACANPILAAEGTARTNKVLSLLVDGSKKINGVAFDIGVPQRLMKETIVNYTAEDAPSPLGELYWSWASGYRHFLFNFQIKNSNRTGEGYIHVGSRDCGGNGAQALLDKEECGFVNNPKVMLTGFDPDKNEITVDVKRILQGASFASEGHGSAGLGLACHSAPATTQPDCAPVFANLGVSLETGQSNAAANSVFSYR